MMKRKLVSFLIALIMVIGAFNATTFAASGVTVILDGKTLSFDVPPQIMNGRTMVPLRAIFEAMGATINWDGNTQTVTATKGDTVVVLKIGSTSPTINGKVVTIDQPGVIVNGRTLAPLRFVAEAFGGTVAWDGGTQTATITSAGSTVQPSPTPTPPPSGGTDSKLIGRWDTSLSGYAYSYYFREDGTFLFTVTGTFPGFRSGNYSVSNGWITFTNVEARDVNNNIEEWPETVRVEYRFETVDDPNYNWGEYLIIARFSYPQFDELPLSFTWARWEKMH